MPVSWVLIDDGWSQTHNNKLTGFGADPTRFPQGLAHTIDVLKQDYGVRYVGVWQAFQGYWGGADPDSDAFKERGFRPYRQAPPRCSHALFDKRVRVAAAGIQQRKAVQTRLTDAIRRAIEGQHPTCRVCRIRRAT